MDKPWLSKTAADMDSGQHIDPKLAQTTFRKYAERWLKAQTSDPTSRESVNSQIRLHALPYLGPRPLGSFKPEHIREWLASRLPRTGASSSPASQRSSTPPSMTSTCARTLAARAPCAQPARNAQKVAPWASERVFAAQAALPEQYRAMVDLGAGCGPRQGEAFGLAEEAIRFGTGWVHVGCRVKVVEGELVSLCPSARRSGTYPSPRRWLKH